ncbi:MAG: hypothetical protein ACXVBE_00410 [Bdellovibrionota bacterium]
MKALNKHIPMLLMAGMLVAQSMALAGGNASGGGTGTVNKNGKPVLLDLVETKENLEGPLERFDPREQEAFKNEIAPRLAKIDALVPVMKGEVSKSIDEIVESSSFYFTDKELPNSNDTCLMTKIPPAQAAVQRNGRVLVNREWYNNADSETRAALLTHEIVMLKIGQGGCSDAVRAATRNLMSPEKLSPQQLAKDLLINVFGKYVPMGIFEANIPPHAEFSGENSTWDKEKGRINPAISVALNLMASPQSPAGLCLRMGQNQLRQIVKDPEVAEAIEKLRFDSKANFIDLYLNIHDNRQDQEYQTSLVLDPHMTTSSTEDNDLRTRSKFGSYLSLDKEWYSVNDLHGAMKNLIARGACSVSKKQVLTLIEANRKEFIEKTGKKTDEEDELKTKERKADPSALENCSKELVSLEKSAENLNSAIEQFPDSWIKQLSLKVSGPSSVYFWNHWSLAGCQAKKQALQLDLERLGNVKSLVEKKYNVVPATETETLPIKSQSAE